MTTRALTARPAAGSAAHNQYGTFAVSYATEKQTNYIHSILSRKDLSSLADGVAAQLWDQCEKNQINKTAASAIIDMLLALPDATRNYGTPGGADFNKAEYELAIQDQVKKGAPATDKQKAFVRTLLAEREGTITAGKVRQVLNDARFDGLTAELVSNCIEMLLTVKVESAKIPDGKYALPAEDGHFVFYQISNPTEGKWAGYTFVSQLVGSVGDWSEQRLSRQVSDSVKARIAADVEEAARMFGIKAKSCSYCASPLSNLQSRAAGYGETCAHNHGFYYPSVEEAKEILAERGEE